MKIDDVIVTYMDFSKAFDRLCTVGWSTWLDHMRSMIQNGWCLREAVDSCFSDWRTMNSGVPWGSVLGHVICINDLDVNAVCLVSNFMGNINFWWLIGQ